MRVILGSSSKWRRALAKEHLGLDVELLPADIDEKKIAHEANPKTPEEHTLVIAKAKLDHLLSMISSDPKRDERPVIIICCDTIVYYNGEILEKPIDHEDCVRMIKLWGKKGCRTEIYTATAVGSVDGPKDHPRIISLSDVERSDVVMTRDLQDNEIKNYISKSDCIKSSGAVIVEDLMDINSAVIDGDRTVIEGLPIKGVQKMMDEIKSKINSK